MLVLLFFGRIRLAHQFKFDVSGIKYVHKDNIKLINTVGFILMFSYIVQVLSGILIASMYTCDVFLAFISIVYISKEVSYGYIIRNLHGNGTTFIFIGLYIHIYKSIKEGIYYYNVNTFYSGLMIYILTMGISFLGYSIAFGQMSYWGCTVITNLIVITNIKELLLGGSVIGQAMLMRFFVLHFLLPMLSLITVTLHIGFLHSRGSVIL